MQRAPSRPQVSIVVPCFNKLELTRACLESLAAAPPTVDVEIIVVDNGSSDGTREYLLAQAGPRFKVIVNETNRNFAGACNQGLKAARAPYVLFLNNDTEVGPGFLEPLVAVLDDEPDVAVVGSKLLYPDGSVQHAGVVLLHHNDGELLYFGHVYSGWRSDLPCVNQRRDFQVVTAACALMRAHVVRYVGGFDEAFRNSCEDIDLCLRIRQIGWRVVYEPASVLVHYESQTTGRRDHDAENLELLHAKWHGKVWSDERDTYLADGYSDLAELAEHSGLMRKLAAPYMTFEGLYARGAMRSAPAAAQPSRRTLPWRRRPQQAVSDDVRELIVSSFRGLSGAYSMARRGNQR